MQIEFRELKQDEVQVATAFEPPLNLDPGWSLDRRMSISAINAEGRLLGIAMHRVSTGGRRWVRVHVREDVNPGLARLLIDRAIQKVAAEQLTAAAIEVATTEVGQETWDQANWFTKLPQTPPPSFRAPTRVIDPAPTVEPIAAEQLVEQRRESRREPVASAPEAAPAEPVSV